MKPDPKHGNFHPGERVTYYPVKRSHDDNRHWPAEVVEARWGGRYLVMVIAPPPIAGRRIVTARRLARQGEIVD